MSSTPWRWLGLFSSMVLAAGCAPSVGSGDGHFNLGGDMAGTTHTSDGGGAGVCANPLDLMGCPCSASGQTRACYTGPAATQHVGLCSDGTQTCEQQGEFLAWGPCNGSVTPAAEVCSDGQDHSCDGKTGCDDPMCAGMAGCCTAGTTRSCYDGPSGTAGHGTCHAGTQTCDSSGAWLATCAGESLPGVEGGHCSDGIDNDCNGMTDCADAACVSDAACKPKDCQPGSTRPCYTGASGTAGVGACHGGTQTCDNTGSWSSTCAGEVTPGNEFGNCHDNVDNDCNGLTDCQDFFCLFDTGCQPTVCSSGDTQNCYDGPSGTSGVGPCHGGTQTCKSDGSGWNACMNQVVPTSEGGNCSDGVDNDCNGLTDCQDAACLTAAACCTTSSGTTDTTIWAHSPDTLYQVDPTTWTLTTVGSFNVGDQMTDLAVTPSGALYTISFTSLYSVSKTSGQATYIAAINGSGNNSMTFLPDGTLLVADSAGAVTRVDPSSGAVSSVGSFGNGYSSSGDLVAVASGTMYGISSTSKGGGDASGDNVLLRVDVNTGVATGVGPIGFGNVWGLAYANSHVIAFTNQGDIVQIDPQTGAGTLLANRGVQFWGAGQSPLVQDNACH